MSDSDSESYSSEGQYGKTEMFEGQYSEAGDGSGNAAAVGHDMDAELGDPSKWQLLGQIETELMNHKLHCAGDGAGGVRGSGFMCCQALTAGSVRKFGRVYSSYDPSEISVYNELGQQLGSLPVESSQLLAPHIDAGRIRLLGQSKPTGYLDISIYCKKEAESLCLPGPNSSAAETMTWPQLVQWVTKGGQAKSNAAQNAADQLVSYQQQQQFSPVGQYTYGPPVTCPHCRGLVFTVIGYTHVTCGRCFQIFIVSPSALGVGGMGQPGSELGHDVGGDLSGLQFPRQS
eukprot:TRINITY_DN666_c0_g1::TRINITY_DN666_c0_g1_i1::g.28880::m.28880 TRINITY_DN666_c0_g1::TRINITY_DN666_c0_g1_i1::g.28880  ORF type:complete len:307 (+),score=36.46,HIRAN/PF08797.6/0.0075,zinc_ribbon_5/PF13719.1/65,zinc_ribbon_5/PF13719.1/8.3 TRINITY_DN666_c0_g1_i1:59-922(+)